MKNTEQGTVKYQVSLYDAWTDELQVRQTIEGETVRDAWTAFEQTVDRMKDCIPDHMDYYAEWEVI